MAFKNELKWVHSKCRIYIHSNVYVQWRQQQWHGIHPHQNLHWLTMKWYTHANTHMCRNRRKSRKSTGTIGMTVRACGILRENSNWIFQWRSHDGRKCINFAYKLDINDLPKKCAHAGDMTVELLSRNRMNNIFIHKIDDTSLKRRTKKKTKTLTTVICSTFNRLILGVWTKFTSTRIDTG